jgi:hypothetical protein
MTFPASGAGPGTNAVSDLRGSVCDVDTSGTHLDPADFHRAIRSFVERLAAEDPALTTRYDYRIDVYRKDGGVEPFIFKTDPRDPPPR